MIMNNPIQDTFLNTLRKGKTSVTFFLINGFQMKGILTHFDNFVVVIQTVEGKQQMIFKHAISTIVSSNPINLEASGEQPKSKQKSVKQQNVQ